MTRYGPLILTATACAAAALSADARLVDPSTNSNNNNSNQRRRRRAAEAKLQGLPNGGADEFSRLDRNDENAEGPVPGTERAVPLDAR